MRDLPAPPPHPVRWRAWKRSAPGIRTVVIHQLAFEAKHEAAVILKTEPGDVEVERVEEGE